MNSCKAQHQLCCSCLMFEHIDCKDVVPSIAATVFDDAIMSTLACFAAACAGHALSLGILTSRFDTARCGAQQTRGAHTYHQHLSYASRDCCVVLGFRGSTLASRFGPRTHIARRKRSLCFSLFGWGRHTESQCPTVRRQCLVAW